MEAKAEAVTRADLKTISQRRSNRFSTWVNGAFSKLVCSGHYVDFRGIRYFLLLDMVKNKQYEYTSPNHARRDGWKKIG